MHKSLHLTPNGGKMFFCGQPGWTAICLPTGAGKSTICKWIQELVTDVYTKLRKDHTDSGSPSAGFTETLVDSEAEEDMNKSIEANDVIGGEKRKLCAASTLLSPLYDADDDNDFALTTNKRRSI
ncbi:uncharacterized protein LOC144881664 [Branchiostoma floridae x Branchiostoma japonicum]